LIDDRDIVERIKVGAAAPAHSSWLIAHRKKLEVGRVRRRESMKLKAQS